MVQQVGPQMPQPPNEAEGQNPKPKGSKDDGKEKFDWRGTSFKMIEAALTTFASVAILGFVTALLWPLSDSTNSF